MSLSMNEPMIHQRELLDPELDDMAELIVQIRDADRRHEKPEAGVAWFAQFGPDARREFAATRRLPDCIEWRADD